MEDLSLTGRRWKARAGGSLDAAPIDGKSLCALLAEQRGIVGSDKAFAVVPGMDPSAFPALGTALTRVREAMKKKETIGIFGDYDCDGITSTALMIRAFERRGVRPIVRLPHRSREGYGLKEHIINEMDAADVTLLITLDTGVTAFHEITEAVARGIDVIVLDHHRLPAVLPPALAILHPALAVPLPLAAPAAAGVTWSFVRALEAADGHDQWEGWTTDIALAAIGTIGDLVELRGENRSLVQAGIRALASITDGPLQMLQMQAGVRAETLTSRDIGFRLAPRLNAAGRMADPAIALRALLGDHHALMQLDELNTQRQTLVKHLSDQLLKEMASDTRAFLSVVRPEFQPGICGLLAGKLCDQLGKPTLVGCVQANDMCVASLRSIPGYDVTAALQRNAPLLEHFGGHAQAAGCSFRHQQFLPLRESLAADVLDSIAPEDLTPQLLVDACMDARHLTLDLCEQLHALEPFGQGNPEPSLLLRNVLLRDARAIGHDRSHLQAHLLDKKIIGFRLGAFAETVSAPVDLVCHIGIDSWRGARVPQLFVEDLRLTIRDVDQETEKGRVSSNRITE